ncbi:MAG: SGNH/GDSL hydrolase family protein [Rhodospirillaceae bacterium]|nr:SGNH/GDSL hydrolase family protein [Rhodospirillales bacterium]
MRPLLHLTHPGATGYNAPMRTISAVLAVLLVLAVIVELSFGTWFSKDPLDQSDLGRNSAVTVAAAALYPGGQDFTYRRDAWGFRGIGRDPASITILTVGGGTTDQHYLPDDQTWQSVMERDFRAAGVDAVVANAGIDGEATLGHVRAFEDWFSHVPGLKPRFVLFSVGLDESTNVVRDESSVVRRHSALLRMVERLSEPKPVEAQPVEPSEGRPNRASIAGYKERLTRLAQLAHAMGAVPVFVVQGVWADELTARRLADFNHATRDVCKEAGLLCLDMAREVTFEAGDFYDHLHNSPQGAEKVGRWLAGKLAGLV